MIANKPVADVTSLSQLTTWSSPDQALCTSPTSGPQVETLQEMKDLYKGQASSIHVEVYDNLDEIQGDLGAVRYSHVVEAWG